MKLHNKNVEPEGMPAEVIGLYAIKDELSGFTSPIGIQDDKMAKRYFKTQLELNPMMKQNPVDFSIWLVGYYHTKKGIIRAIPENELVKVDWGVKNE